MSNLMPPIARSGTNDHRRDITCLDRLPGWDEPMPDPIETPPDVVQTILEDKTLRRDVLRKVARGETLQTDALASLQRLSGHHVALRKIIQTTGRPAYFVQNGAPQIHNACDGWEARLATCREDLRRAIRATARIEIDADGETTLGGTAWLVAPRLMVTNRHVVRTFATRRPDGSAVIGVDRRGVQKRVRVDFVGENDVADAHLVSVERTIPFLAEDGDDVPDIALLQLADDVALPDPVAIAESTPQAALDRWVVCIGYPADGDDERAVLDDIFGKVFDVKRVAPGIVAATPAAQWYFNHDCSTLEGSSGSLLLDVATGSVVGLHFEGSKRQANYAVRAEHLRETLGPLLEARGQALRDPPLSARGSSLIPPVVSSGPRRTAARVLQERVGYLPDFLGDRAQVALPRVTANPDDRATLLGSTETVLKYATFSLELRRSRRLPSWTAANVRPAGREHTARVAWRDDPRASSDAQLGAWFYERSKLSRGQMVRRLGAVWGDDWRDANDDTFLSTNACPQVETFDDAMWSALEEHALYECADDRRISVLAGPIFADDDPELFGVQLPVRFWKIIAFAREGRLTAGAFVTSREGNADATRWAPYQWTVAALEKEIGIDFGGLHAVDREAAVEGTFQRKRRIYGVDEVRF